MDILSFANTKAGRYLLGADGFPIIKVSPNSYHQLVDIRNDKSIIRGTFFVGNYVQKVLEIPLTKMDIAREQTYDAFLHYSGLEEKRNVYPRIYLVTTTFNAGTGDGELHQNVNPETYANVRASATANEINNQPTDGGRFLASYRYAIGVAAMCSRTFYPVDTSSLTVNAIISSVLLNVSMTTATGADTSPDGIVVPATQASTSTLASADFDNFAYTAWSDVITVNADTGTFTWTFNATGIAGVSKTGYTKFALINNTYDYGNTTPPVSGNIWRDSLNSGTGSGATIPNLSITYTMPGNFLAFM